MSEMKDLSDVQQLMDKHGIDKTLEYLILNDKKDLVYTLIDSGYVPENFSKSNAFLAAVRVLNFSLVKYLAKKDIYHIGGTHTIDEYDIDYMGEYSLMITEFVRIGAKPDKIDKLFKLICWCVSNIPIDGMHESFFYAVAQCDWELDYVRELINICLDKKWFNCNLSTSSWDVGFLTYVRLYYLLNNGFDNTDALSDCVACHRDKVFTKLVCDYVHFTPEQWNNIDARWFEFFADYEYAEHDIELDDIDNLRICIDNGMPVNNTLIQLLVAMSYGEKYEGYQPAKELAEYVFSLKRCTFTKDELISKWKEYNEQGIDVDLVDEFITHNWV